MGDFLNTEEGLLAAENLSYDYARALTTAENTISADQAEQYRAWYLGRILAPEEDDVDRVVGQYSASGLSAFMANRNARILEPFHFIEEQLGTTTLRRRRWAKPWLSTYSEAFLCWMAREKNVS